MVAKRKKRQNRTLPRKITVIHKAEAKLTRKRYERIGDVLTEKIRELANEGQSKSQIARALKVSRQAVQDITRDIKATPRVHRARADMVREIMDRYKPLASLLTRLKVPMRHLFKLADVLREKASRVDDTMIEMLVDDHQAYLHWFQEAMSTDTDFMKHHPELIGIGLSFVDDHVEMSVTVPDGRVFTLKTGLPQSAQKQLPPPD